MPPPLKRRSHECHPLQYIAANPGSWALCSGVDFVELALLPHIHYGAAHMYEEMR